MEKITGENILRFGNRSFTFRDQKRPENETLGYHSHPEMELAVMEGGTGIRTVNGIAERFGDIEIVFTPGNCPLKWEADSNDVGNMPEIRDRFFQFPPKLLAELKTIFPEFIAMADFYLGLKTAIVIYGETARWIIDKLESFQTLRDSEQVVCFIEILNYIYLYGDYRPVGVYVADAVEKSKSRLRFHLINKLITENYSRHISLQEAADIVGMSPTAFCNTFKASTTTTFYNYLMTYRMHKAASLLSTTLLNVSEIAFHVGYQDVPHFNRHFKRYFHITPTYYRRRYKSEDKQ